MDRAWKHFDDAPRHAVEVPPAVLEKVEDENYATDFATLVGCYRVRLGGRSVTAPAFVAELTALGKRMLDGFGPGGLFEQQAFSDHGPAFLLRALAKAYEQPEHELGELHGD